MKITKKCMNCNKTISALKTYVHSEHLTADFCSVACLIKHLNAYGNVGRILEETNSKIIDPKMETPNVPIT